MILRQYVHTEPVIAASYLLGCGGRKLGTMVDDIPPALPGAAATRAANLGIAAER